MAGWAGNDPAPIPQWAIDRANELAQTESHHYPHGHAMAFARYIAQHEQPPVDPAPEIMRDYHRVTGEFVNSVFQNKLEHYTRWLIAAGHIPDRKHKEAGE